MNNQTKKVKQKDKPIEVFYEYEPTPDGDKRLGEIFEFLLSGKNKPLKRDSSNFPFRK